MPKVSSSSLVINASVQCVSVSIDVTCIWVLQGTSWVSERSSICTVSEKHVLWPIPAVEDGGEVSVNRFKGIVHQKNLHLLKLSSPSDRLRCRWVCFFVSFGEIRHSITCSPMDPLQGMGAVSRSEKLRVYKKMNLSLRRFKLQTFAYG